MSEKSTNGIQIRRKLLTADIVTSAGDMHHLELRDKRLHLGGAFLGHATTPFGVGNQQQRRTGDATQDLVPVNLA